MEVRRSVIIFICVLGLTTKHALCTWDVSEVHEIQEFLAQCEEELVFHQEYKDVVLVLGNTGAGKTTFTQWIAGDDSKLISTKVGAQDYIITDNNGKIGNSTIQSKTIFPELVVDNNTNTAYYDISGFSDTGGIKHDLATSYFIKRIIDNVKSIKTLLVVNFSSVRPGVDRLDLIRLLTHFVELFKNIEKYFSGIGLIVTKVDNNFIQDSDDKTSFVTDEEIVTDISYFLKNVAQEVKENFTSSDEIRTTKIVKLINSLAHSFKIALFRRPNRPGPLSEIPLLQEAKPRVQNIIFNYLQFIPTKSDDFSYMVSEGTKSKLHNLIEALEKSLEENIRTVANDLFKYYNGILTVTENKMKHEVHINDTENIDSNLSEINQLIEQVDEALSKIYSLAFDLKNAKQAQNISNFIKNTSTNLNVNVSRRNMLNISAKVNFLDFIQDNSIIKFKLNTHSLSLTVLETGNKLEKAIILLKDSITQLLIKVDINIKNELKKVAMKVKNKVSKYNEDAHDVIKGLLKQNVFYHDALYAVTQPFDPEEKLRKIFLMLDLFNISLSNYISTKITNVYYLNFFINEINILLENLDDLKKWYKFLDVLYDKLSSYEVQKNKSLRSQCSNFIVSIHNDEGKKIKDSFVAVILQDCYRDVYLTEYNNIKNITLTQTHLQLLKNITDLTLKNDTLFQEYIGSKLVVKGRFVILSAIKIYNGTSMSSLVIFAIEKVFIDIDLDFTGKNIQMTIMAPSWEIIGERKIILNGSPGKMVSSKAKPEESGLPGNPGGNAGDFLAFGATFIGGTNLLISAIGGDGSPGQDGGDGKPGKDAIDYGVTGRDKSRCNYLKLNFVYCSDYTSVVTSCTNGGDPRFGGAGGQGGAEGIVKLFFNAPFKVNARKGKDGRAGSVGTPGRAGKPLPIKKVQQLKVNFYFKELTINQGTKAFYNPCYPGRSLKAKKQLLKGPKPSPKTEYISQRIFEEFKSFLKENLQKSLRKENMIRSINKSINY